MKTKTQAIAAVLFMIPLVFLSGCGGDSKDVETEAPGEDVNTEPPSESDEQPDVSVLPDGPSADPDATASAIIQALINEDYQKVESFRRPSTFAERAQNSADILHAKVASIESARLIISTPGLSIDDAFAGYYAAKALLEEYKVDESGRLPPGADYLSFNAEALEIRVALLLRDENYGLVAGTEFLKLYLPGRRDESSREYMEYRAFFLLPGGYSVIRVDFTLILEAGLWYFEGIPVG